MLSLNEYILNSTQLDAHVHSFGIDSEYISPIECVHMVDNQIKYNIENQSFLSSFEKHFKKQFKYNLIVGCNGDESIKLYNLYKDKIIGFGEVKLYKHYISLDDNTKKYYEDYDNLNKILSINTHLPIWIHFDLNETNKNKLEHILQANPEHNFVLCHCGINELDDKNVSFKIARQLQLKNNNLWLDISWIALDYIDEQKLSLLETNRVLVGSDINLLIKHPNQQLNKFKKISKYISPYINLNRLISTSY